MLQRLTGLLLACSLLTTSCNENRKTEEKDSKDISEEHNKAKFESNDSEKDAHFMVEAAITNLTEIQLGQLAQQKGTSSDVKELGKMMEKEHRASLAELKALASKKVISIPDSSTEDVQAAYKKLNDKHGKDFDTEFCEQMVKGHKEAISSFEKESREGKDADILTWTQNTLPVLRTHLEHAINCQERCNKDHKLIHHSAALDTKVD